MKALPLLALAMAGAMAQAATVIPGYDNSTDGGVSDVAFPYLAKATFGLADSWSTTATPGGWSFRDLDPTKNQNRGWGHSTRWFLVELTQASFLTVSMSSLSSLANPGIVIYGGESISDDPNNLHTYSNNGLDAALLNSPWNTNGDLSYLDSAHSGVTTGLGKTFNLAAGLYTIGLGNAADSSTFPSAITYDVGFSVIPEPSCLLLSGSASLLMLRRRRA